MGNFDAGGPKETVRVEELFTRDVTETGSFDIWGGFWATTFGKVLQALPIPALLVDPKHQVRVANQACAKISPEYESKLRTAFFEWVPDDAAKQEARSIIDRVFLTREPSSPR